VLVCAVVIEDGEHETVTDVMVGVIVVAETTTLLDPDLVVSCVEVAVMIAVPVPLGVKTPADVIVPPVADHVTAEL
jgi:hypothetical protein